MKKQLTRLIPLLLILSIGGWLFSASAAAQGNDLDSLSARVVAKGYLTALKTGYLNQAQLNRFYLTDSVAASDVAQTLSEMQPQSYRIAAESLTDADTAQFTAILQPGNRSLLLTVSRTGNQWKITNLMWAATNTVTLVSAGGTEATANATAETFGTATVTTGELNVRSGPGTGYTVLTTLKQGETVDVIGTNAAQTWLNVAQNGTELGWMTASANYVDSTVTGELPVVASGGTPVAATAASNSTGTLIVQAQSGGTFYLVSDDRTKLTPLTNGIDPVLSPDGTQIAFTRWSSGNAGSVWVYDPATGIERAVLGETQQAKSPAWSADGTQLVVAFQSGGRPTIESYTVSPGTRIPREAYDINRGSVTGNISYKLPADPYWKLRLIDVETGTFEDLPSATYSMAPTWDTANTWRVVFANTSDGLLQLDLNQGEYFSFTSDSKDRSPIFSPDGSAVAVSYKQDDHWEIHTIDTATSQRTQLTSTPASVTIEQMIAGQSPQAWNNAAPQWSPDGSQIAFISDRSGQWEFWVMNADGSNPQPLLSAEAAAQLDIDYNGMDEKLISWR